MSPVEIDRKIKAARRRALALRKTMRLRRCYRVPLIPQKKNSGINRLDHSTALATDLNVVDVLRWRFRTKIAVHAAKRKSTFLIPLVALGLQLPLFSNFGLLRIAFHSIDHFLMFAR